MSEEAGKLLEELTKKAGNRRFEANPVKAPVKLPKAIRSVRILSDELPKTNLESISDCKTLYENDETTDIPKKLAKRILRQAKTKANTTTLDTNEIAKKGVSRFAEKKDARISLHKTSKKNSPALSTLLAIIKAMFAKPYLRNGTGCGRTFSANVRKKQSASEYRNSSDETAFIPNAFMPIGSLLSVYSNRRCIVLQIIGNII